MRPILIALALLLASTARADCPPERARECRAACELTRACHRPGARTSPACTSAEAVCIACGACR